MDVAFCVVPFGPVLTPSLGSSILKSSLANYSIDSRIFYASLDFADLIGIPSYLNILESPAGLLVGEYIFSHAAFPQSFDSTFSEAESQYGDFFEFVSPTLKEIAINCVPLVKDYLCNLAVHILSFSPRIVICSSMFQQNTASLALFNVIKSLDSSVTTLMGGCNTEYSLGLALLRRSSTLDLICSGAGESTLPIVCQHILDNKSFSELSRIPGVITSLDLDNFPDIEPDINILSRGTLLNLNQSPDPSFDDYFNALSSKSLNISPAIPLESSRGCWWGEKSHCTFCGLNGSDLSYRYTNSEALIELMDDLSSAYECHDFTFVDNIIPLSFFESFLPLLSERSFNIFYESKANLTRHQISLFKNAGVNVIQPGIESLLDGPLRLMRKGTTQIQNLQCLRYCSDFSIVPQWSILWNFPGEETAEYFEYLELIPKILHLYPPGVMASIRFDKFSPYHSEPEAWGLELEPLPSYSYLYPDFSGSRADIAYFFKKKDVNYHPIPFIVPYLSNNLPAVFQDVFSSVTKWQSLWSNTNNHPVLKFIHIDDQHYILDTRYGGDVTSSLSPRLLSILRVLDTPLPISAICSRLHTSPDSIQYNNLMDDLSHLLELKWIVLSGKKYFSLVTNCEEYSYHDRFPFGGYDSVF